METNTTSGAELIAKLANDRPDVAIKVTRKIDRNYTWDGDGPDPEDDGFDPYIVRVRAYTIRNGKLFYGDDVLCGCYLRPDEPTGEIHGYLPQMIDGAIEEMEQMLRMAHVS